MISTVRPQPSESGVTNLSIATGNRQGNSCPPAQKSLLRFLPWLLAAQLASCNASSRSLDPVSSDLIIRNGSFQLRVLNDSIFAQAEFRLMLSEAAEGPIVAVQASRVQSMKAIYLELTYDDQLWQPLGTDSGGLLAKTGQALALSVDRVPGQLQHGEVLANWPGHMGFSGDGVLATFRFSSTADRDVAPPVRTSSAAPDSDQAQQYLSYSVNDARLSWYYANPGDYDQNGVVSISDLTPLGMHFNEAGPFPATSTLSVIDGDGNDLISISDITPIGANFGRQVDSYAVYGSADAADYPSGNTAANGPGTRRLATLPFSAALGGVADRKHWEYTMDSPVVNGRYWVRPTSDGLVGTASRLTSPYQQSWHFRELLDYAPLNQSTSGSDLAMIAGKPAVVYFVFDPVPANVSVYYRSATDELGLQWGTPQSVTVLPSGNFAPVLVQAQGTPGFSWYDDNLGRIVYKRANDVQGSSWDPSVTVVSKYSFLNRLVTHEDRIVSGYRGDSSGLFLSLSLDAQGATWLPGVSQYAPIGQWDKQADIVSLPGGIGSAVDDFSTGALEYVYAPVSGTAITPQAPVTVFPQGSGYNLSLAIGTAAGLPFVVTRRAPTEKLYSSQALDATGSSWTTPDLMGMEGIAGYLDVTGAFGVPWLVYFDDDADILHCGYATSPSSGQWAQGPDLRQYPVSSGLVVTSIDMETVGNRPAVLFREVQEKKLMYAIFY